MQKWAGETVQIFVTFPNYACTTNQKKVGPTFFFCPLGGSQIFFGPPEKEYGKKNAGDTNFFLDKMII